MGYQHIDVQPLVPAVGAMITGVDLSASLSDDVVREIRDAWLEHLVVFFRDQDLDPGQFVRLAKRFGEISYYPFVKGMESQPEIVEVVKNPEDAINFGGLWHTDTSYLELPPMASMLLAKEVPEIGGDTLFANMYAAYEALSGGMKQLLEGLVGINSAENPNAAITRVSERRQDANDVVTTASHPLVRTHAETGRKSLYCSAAHTIRIEGMSLAESRPILETIYAVQLRPEFACRFHWEPGSIAFWDNRCAQHNALNDYPGERRVMQRITLAGDSPR